MSGPPEPPEDGRNDGEGTSPASGAEDQEGGAEQEEGAGKAEGNGRIRFDAGGFVASSKDPKHSVPFLAILVKQPLFNNYVHSRMAATMLDCLDRNIAESLQRRYQRLNGKLPLKLGIAHKAKVDTHSTSFLGPRNWTLRMFELHKHDARSSSDHRMSAADLAMLTAAVNDQEILDLIYYDSTGEDELKRLEGEIEKCRKKEKSDKSRKVRDQRKEHEQAYKAKKMDARKGIFPLIKGETELKIPERRHSFQTKFAFEIHVKHSDEKTRVMTICCQDSKHRGDFIGQLQSHLYKASDIQKMLDCIPEEIRKEAESQAFAHMQEVKDTMTRMIPHELLGQNNFGSSFRKAHTHPPTSGSNFLRTTSDPSSEASTNPETGDALDLSESTKSLRSEAANSVDSTTMSSLESHNG